MRHLFSIGFFLISVLSHAQTLRVVRSSADGTLALTEQKPLAPIKAIVSSPAVINTQKRYQQIIGFGGTYSEATAYNLKRLSESKRNEVLRAFFDPKTGAGWNLMRTTINSCDASSEYYSYDESDGDTELKNFSIQKDIDNYMLPGLKAASQINSNIKIFASPWTPPIWMKDSRAFNHGSLLPKYYSTWAKYFSYYLSAYKKEGVDVWAVTPQNEPEAYRQAWDACGWKPGEMKTFIADYLGPQLQRDHPNVKLLAWDHNKNHMLAWCDTLLSDPRSACFIKGIAHHWYEEGEGKFYTPLLDVAKKYPGLPLIAAEQGVFGLYLKDGAPAELYARDIMGNLQHGSAGWVVWGMAFDHTGGPNHARNFNHSPIMIDVAQQVIHYNPSYYYIAQFSRYIKPGATRVALENIPDGLQAATCQNPDGELVTVALNENTTNKEISLQWKNKIWRVEVPARSIATLLINSR